MPKNRLCKCGKHENITYVSLFISETIYKKEEQSGYSSLITIFIIINIFPPLWILLWEGLLLPGFSVLCLHLLADMQSCTPMRLMRALLHWPCSRSWRSETNAELASVRAVNRMSPMCNIAARITNRFSTSYTFYKDRKHIELLRRKMKRQIL